MRKLLMRGTAPPLHPDAERNLLTMMRLPLKPVSNSGDMSPELETPLALTGADFVPPEAQAVALDGSLTDSEAEKELMTWAQTHHPAIARWLLPQVHLGALAGAVSEDADRRRCDFLLAAPGSPPMVIEVDGAQHEEQKLVDEHRDRMLAAAGVAVVRVPVAEATALRAISAFDTLAGRPGAMPQDEPGPLSDMVWAACHTHRLMLAICEALASGLLSGAGWDITLQDHTQRAALLIGPYLALLDAFDAMWGDGTIAPQTVRFAHSDTETVWHRDLRCSYSVASAPMPAPAAAVSIVLDSGLGAAAALPEPGQTPAVVVRSSWLPALARDHMDAPPRRVAPFAAADPDDTSVALTQILRGVFAKHHFLEGQFEAVTETLAGRDCAVLLPTGAGKSMIYQIAGLCMPGRTLIVDPLVALIEDQILSLGRHGMDRAVGITASANRLGEAADAHFVFVAPERLQRQTFRDELTERGRVLPVNLAVIDEAHCVSEWGHDFRTAYLNFGKVLRRCCDGALGSPPLLALTGTASRAVLTDVLFQLGIVNTHEHTLVRPVSFDRPELSYHVTHATPADSQAALRGELRAMPSRFRMPAASFFEPTGRDSDTYSGIVFVTTVRGRRGLSAVIDDIRELAPTAVRYSGRAPKDVSWAEWNAEKAANADSFKGNDATVIVTTKAFGMGIDKSNVRWVVHYGLPMSIEGYYQEVGRSGRDRRQAHCVLIVTEHDSQRNRVRLNDEPPETTPKIRRSERDDIHTALWFHAQSFPPQQQELQRVLRLYDRLASGDTELPLGSGEDNDGDNERALHRLSILGVIDDYTLEGRGRSTKATTRRRDPRPADIADNLLSFVERSQPGRSSAVRSKLSTPHRTLRDAVDNCAAALIGLVYETIERSRRRSLREMWLIAADAATSDPEVIRQRVLEYLTEGDVSPVALQLAERTSFVFSDWIPAWESIASTEDAKEWRAAAARLLGSYPDHPGLLASRGLAEALLPNGDPAEFETNLRQAFQQAKDPYRATSADIVTTVEWMLRTLGSPPGNHLRSTVAALADDGRVPPPHAAAGVLAAVHDIPDARASTGRWLAANWQKSPALGIHHLADTLESVASLQERFIARHNTRTITQ